MMNATMKYLWDSNNNPTNPIKCCTYKNVYMRMYINECTYI